MRSSSPMSATRNRCIFVLLWWPTAIVTVCVISPIQLVVPSTFWTFHGCFKGSLGSSCSPTHLECIKHSVAPLSRSALVSTLLPSVYSRTGALIDLFLAMYTESVVQARARAVVLRPLKNPLRLLLGPS